MDSRERVESAFRHEEADRLWRETDRAIVGVFGGTVLENGQGIWGWDEFFVRAIEDRDLVHYFLGALTERQVEALKRYLRAAGDRLSVVVLGDDLGGQSGPLMDLEFYRRHLLPYHTRLFRAAREGSRAHLLFHTDGAVADFLPDLIEAGLEAINPLQTDAAGMDPVSLKRRFGKRLLFWGGGSDTHSVLGRGTPSQVREDVRRRAEALAPGGGWVFNQIHNILPEVPAANILAAYEAAREFGRYPREEPDWEALEARYRAYWGAPLEELKGIR